MCGLAGILTLSDQINVIECLTKAKETQFHRGPDIQHQIIEHVDHWTLGFCHQRLSVLDLSDAGSQPMLSNSANSWVIYNGEVYNYVEIKAKLNQTTYKSNTDTEVMLNALEQFGIYEAVNQFNGMWAFAWYDKLNQKLFLCRDRIGVKPLYYYQKDHHLFFASEIKTILEMSGDKFNLDLQTVGEYIEQSLQNSSENTFYQEIKAVPAAHYMEIDLKQPFLDIKTSKYWDVLNAKPYSGKDLQKHARFLFNDAVRLRMRSDVPVGITLSGGLDSSSIAKVMKQNLGEHANMHILSAVSPGNKLDESKFIDIMADNLKATVHKVELKWGPTEAINLLKKAIWHNDAPLGSFSNVAHYLLMKKAYELGITVILSGQGADELLCGYKKYVAFYLQFLLRKRKFLSFLYTIAQFIFNRTILNQFNFQESKRYLPLKFKRNQTSILGSLLLKNYWPKNMRLHRHQTLQERQATDLTQFSVPFLTHYEDRMSMAWSREIRLPFLDFRLMELLINLPPSEKIYKGWTKYLLRKAMQNDLPKEIVWRKDKQGFINPQEEWLRHDLKETVYEYFNDNALIFKLGLVNQQVLLEKYKIYCSNSLKRQRVWYREIFNPLSLEIWLQMNKKYINIA